MDVPMQSLEEFRSWLVKKGLNYGTFAAAIKASYHTIAELGVGDNWCPMKKTADKIKRVRRFRDCPLLGRTPYNRMEA